MQPIDPVAARTPFAVKVMCGFSFFYAMATVTLLTTHDAQAMFARSGTGWLVPLLLPFALVWAVAAFGLLLLKRWSVPLFALAFLVVQIILISRHTWQPRFCVVPALFLFTGCFYYNRLT